MKKYLLLYLIVLFSISLSFKQIANAQTASPTNANVEKRISDLKNKIASRVAELNLVKKRGIAGTVTDHSDTQITLSDVNGNNRIVDVDELTNFSSSSNSFGISDIKKGQMISVLGLYNKQSKRILAREIEVIDLFPKIIFGGVGLIDEENFEITLVKENGLKVVVEVEDLTKTFSFTYGNLTRSGFSKISQAQTIIVIGFNDKQIPEKIIASRIILLPEVDATTRINFGVLLTPTIIPSTGSGVKLFPIKQ